MTLNPIGVAVPFFFLLLGLEVVLARRRRRSLHRLNDSMADLTCGMGDQLIALFTKGVTLGAYVLVEERLGFLELSRSSVAIWVFGFLAVDFCYYCYHRFSHRVNLGWATHVVHHQSEEFNLAVALRQPWFSQAYSWLFYIPLAFLGLPWEVYLTCYSFNLIYQFWIHTELIGTMGAFGLVMNTPSHHRVHHGINEAYLDKNYAGVFIVWDRLLGTFAQEDEEVLYGTRKPLRSWNPWTANVQPLLDLVRRSRRARTPQEARRVWTAPPEWVGEGEAAAADYPPPGRGYDRDTGRAVHGYAVGQLVVLGILMCLLITFEQQIPFAWKVGGSLFVLGTGIGWAGMFEQRPWAEPLEWCRLILLIGVGLVLPGMGEGLSLIGYGMVAVGVSSVVALWRCRGDLLIRA